MRTRVKICGVTRIEDAHAAVAAGADAIGMIFDPNSARVVTIEQARAIVAALPPFVSVVGVFVDAAPEAVRAVLNRVALSLLQFHGAEDPGECVSYGRQYIKAIRMRDGVDLRAAEKQFANAAGLLLDTYVPGVAGGSGQAFDWSRVPAERGKPLILSGGLGAANVGAAIRRVRPDAVDVSSGVEVSPGIKDSAKIAAFLRAVRETE